MQLSAGSQPEAPPAVSQHPARDAIRAPLELDAILGAGTHFEGKLSFAGKIRIEGSFEGELLGGELLVIAGDARISGALRAHHVLILGGTIQANITAEESIELCVPAVVTGDLRAPEIILERGISFSGTCTMQPLTEEPPRVEPRD